MGTPNGRVGDAAAALPSSAQVVVVGGGIIGMSTAFQLAKRGVRDVVVLERAHLGAGATGKSGALVRCHYANVPESLLAWRSLDFFRRWDEEVGAGSPRLRQPGFLQVVGPDDADRLRTNVADQQAAGIDTRLVTPNEAREIEPWLRVDDLGGAAFEPNSGYADPNAALFGFAEAAARLGVRVFTDTPALRVVASGGKATGVETARGTIAADAVVVAAGSWANKLFAPLGIDLGLRPARTQVVIFRWPRETGEAGPKRVVIDAVNHSWIRPEGTASTLIGAERDVDGVDPDNLDEGVPASSIVLARKVLSARFPVFERATMRGGWAGTYMRSPDGHPIIDRAPGVDGLWLMTGDSGSSFKTAPAIGICLAEWITDGRPTFADLAPFRATRFAEGQPWIDATSYGDDRTLTVSR